MTTRRRAQPQGRRPQARKPHAGDLWRPVPELGEARPIEPASDPAALLRSLGDPPLQGQGQAAEHYLAAVAERAAALATALAAAAGVLQEPDED